MESFNLCPLLTAPDFLQLVFTIIALAASTSASVIGLGYDGLGHAGLGWGHGYGAINHAALSPIGPSGVVTGHGAAGPSGVVTGAGAVGPSGIVNGHGAVGPTGPNGHGIAIAAPAVWAAPAVGYGLGHAAWGLEHGHGAWH